MNAALNVFLLPVSIGSAKLSLVPACSFCLEFVEFMPTIKVLVVDDFVSFREFVGRILANRPDIQVIGEASDGSEAVQKTREAQPDVILLDIGLPKIMESRQLGRFAS